MATAPLTPPEPESSAEAIERYVHRFLRACGAKVRQVDGAVWEAEPPSWLREELHIASPFRFAFDARHAAPGVEVLGFGSAVLDGMLNIGKRRGESCSLMFADAAVRMALDQACSEDPWSDEPRRDGLEMRGALRRIQFPNARRRLVGRRLLHQNQLLFHFKVAYISDEKREELLALLVDPVTEEVDEPVELGRAVAVQLKPSSQSAPKRSEKRRVGRQVESQPLAVAVALGEDRFGGDAYTLLRLYRKACTHLEAAVASQVARFEAAAEAGLRRELARIDDYYRGMAAESIDSLRALFRRIASTNVRAQMARSTDAQRRYQRQLHAMKREAGELEALYHTELQSLEEERERREAELREKHRVRVEVQLTNVASVRVPRVEWTLRLGGPARREITFLYDVLRDRILELDCESCGKPMRTAVYLCSCGDVVCASCTQRCSGCKTDICPSCTARRCHVCHDLICDECPAACPAGEEWPSLDSAPDVCAACRDDSCLTCQATLRLGTEW